jgi:hypothetical protein
MKKLMLLFSFFSIILLFSSCASFHGGITAKYLNNGYNKPVIAILPVKDQLVTKAYEGEKSWDTSQEITDEVYTRLKLRGDVIVLPKEQITWLLDSEKNGQHIAPETCDFKVSIELIDHKTVAYERGKKARIYPQSGSIDHLLEIRYRLIVEDMRQGRNGKVVLRELQESYHPVSLDETELNYDLIDRDEGYYKHTPLGRGHARLAEEIAKRIADYVPYLKNM